MLQSILMRALQRVPELLSDNVLGRAMLRKIVAMANTKLGFRVGIQPLESAPDSWLVELGNPESGLNLSCSVRTQVLVQLATPILTAWLEDRPFPQQEVMDIVLSSMKGQSV